MSAAEKRTISLPVEQSRYIDHLVETGGYGSASEVVRAGLRALQERDEAVERWLREDVLPAALAIAADPQRAIPIDEVFSGIRALHAEWLKANQRGS
ncbi:type II toxin-antitoxin system ParD family antitoxin [Rhizobium sp. 32-5/1]|uniref:type II toxin-antitoxin system ParD family antitoxin n=1 Tax=Rhizobium sp. 32-5/1 TaxID=3019602 RepID=UPI00240D35B1|nr:type II toxin-antitoxin system ParD family antitoxin [Rhizobium sp. 32-5/1]WEZ82875.1 type II toxin-antitoxin system ParD family antitoxin [Rhizobium sp. 32-5/1]